MTTIVDLSNEPKFTIKTVSSRTGIRPVTLRAWERRHEVLNPFRNDNRYRLYSERDIAILRWLKYQVDEGKSISSAVSELRSLSSASAWPEALPSAPAPAKGLASEKPGADDVKRLYIALVRHDENQAGALLREAHSSYSLLDMFVELLWPVIRQLESARYLGEIEVGVERFASAYLRGKLISMMQAYPSRGSAPLVLVGCAPMEVHELDALMLAVLLRSEGYRVEYLGPDIPLEDLVDYSSYVQPALVVLSANSEYTALQMHRLQEKLLSVRPSPAFAYAGRAFEFQPGLRAQVPGSYLGEALGDALSKMRALLKTSRKRTSMAAPAELIQ